MKNETACSHYINPAGLSKPEWIAHPKFKGVFMKDIVSGNDTNQKMSVHLVMIEPGCEIGEHIHKGKSELHEIVEGTGYALIHGKKVDYFPGMVSFIHEDILHSVKAGEQGLLLSATFTPSLN